MKIATTKLKRKDSTKKTFTVEEVEAMLAEFESALREHASKLGSALQTVRLGKYLEKGRITNEYLLLQLTEQLEAVISKHRPVYVLTKSDSKLAAGVVDVDRICWSQVTQAKKKD